MLPSNHQPSATLFAALIGIAGLIQANAATFFVTTVSDSGPGSLRQALLDANATPGRDRVEFNIAGTAPFIITPNSVLPIVTDAVVIDGTTQPDFAGKPVVALAGNNIVTLANGLRLETTNCEVRALAFNRFTGDGLRMNGGGGHVIFGNYFGVAPNGTSGLGNKAVGLTVNDSANNIVQGNVLSGNEDTGLFINGTSATNNIVIGNFIGTDFTGTLSIGNTNNGVLLQNAQRNFIGGAAAAERNIISGNGKSGVYFYDLGTAENVVLGNFIGTAANGQTGLSNRVDGVTLWAARGNRIGGSAPGEGNVISGNHERGVYIYGPPNFGEPFALSNRVEGNFIGVAADGVTPLGNRFTGVTVAYGSGNVIGGTNAAARNIISGNLQNGVAIGASNDVLSVGNVVAGNFIGTDRTGALPASNAFSGVVVLQGTNTLISGNVISGNMQMGVYLFGGGKTTVAGNRIGADVSGASAVRNGQNGVRIESPANVVGGNSPRARNVISGNGTNGNAGVLFVGLAASNNVLAGNFIGTTASGTAALPNTAPGATSAKRAGVGFTNAPRNTIGGTGPFDGNVIAGNSGYGLYLSGIGASGNRILGNHIGPDVTGTNAIPNDGGLYIFGSPTNFIGSAEVGGGNVISGNYQVGISIGDAGANGTVIVGNFIGLKRNGGEMGNWQHGIDLVNSVSGPALGTIVGGTTPGAPNRIAYAVGSLGYDGVRVRDGSTGNVIRGNSMFGNGGGQLNGLAIDLGLDGVTGNDSNDPDTGGNNLQNFPVITSASGRYVTTVSGTLNSRPNATFILDFYGNTAAEPSGYGEAERWLGSTTVTTGGNNNANFSVSFTNLFGAGSWVTATATDAAGNTSELSAAVAITSGDGDGDGLPDDYELATGTSPGVPNNPLSDRDEDGATDLDEFAAGTDPRELANALRLELTLTRDATLLTFPSVIGRTYRVESAAVVTGPWGIVGDELAGTGTTLRVSDVSGNTNTRFYRVRARSN